MSKTTHKLQFIPKKRPKPLDLSRCDNEALQLSSGDKGAIETLVTYFHRHFCWRLLHDKNLGPVAKHLKLSKAKLSSVLQLRTFFKDYPGEMPEDSKTFLLAMIEELVMNDVSAFVQRLFSTDGIKDIHISGYTDDEGEHVEDIDQIEFSKAWQDFSEWLKKGNPLEIKS